MSLQNQILISDFFILICLIGLFILGCFIMYLREEIRLLKQQKEVNE